MGLPRLPVRRPKNWPLALRFSINLWFGQHPIGGFRQVSGTATVAFPCIILLFCLTRS